MTNIRSASWRAGTLLGAAAALLTAAPSAAVEEHSFRSRTTTDLIDTCTAKPEDPRAIEGTYYCAGFVTGAYATYLAARDPKAPPEYCNLPKTRKEGIGAFMDWARARPELAHRSPIDSLFRFLDETYPCPPSPTPKKR